MHVTPRWYTMVVSERAAGAAKTKGVVNMAEKKMTKRELFTNVHAVLSAIDGAEELADGIAHELALVEKRASAKGTDAKRLAEQNIVRQGILAVLSDGAEHRVTDIAKTIDATPQRVTALISQMVKEGSVTRTQDKKVVTFSLTQ